MRQSQMELKVIAWLLNRFGVFMGLKKPCAFSAEDIFRLHLHLARYLSELHLYQTHEMVMMSPLI